MQDSFNDIEKIFLSKSVEGKDAVISFTRYLVSMGMTSKNYYLFQKIVNLNYQEAADIMFKNRIPDSFFASISPCRELILASLATLISYKPKELYDKNIFACLGILQNAYKKSRAGFKIYDLSISDIQHVGKYFVLNDEKVSDMIIDILESIRDFSDKRFKDEIIMSGNIIDAFFDNKKQLHDVIPQTLLV